MTVGVWAERGKKKIASRSLHAAFLCKAGDEQKKNVRVLVFGTHCLPDERNKKRFLVVEHTKG